MLFYFKNKASVAPNPLVSLIGRLLARSGRKRGNRRTDGQNDKTTTVTLAAHAHRGLIMMMMMLESLLYVRVSECRVSLSEFKGYDLSHVELHHSVHLSGQC